MARQSCKKEWGRYLLFALLSFCAASAILMVFRPIGLEEYQKETVLTRIIWDLKNSYSSGGVFPLSVCFLAFWSLGCFVLPMSKKEGTVSVGIVNALLAVILLCGRSFQIDNTLNSLCSSEAQVVKSVVFYAGYFYLLNCAGFAMYEGLFAPAFNMHLLKEKKYSAFAYYFHAHPMFCSTMLIMLVWLPHLIIAYPSYSCQDADWQLSQFLGVYPYTSHHPPIQTLFMGAIVKFGATVFAPNFGLFLYILIQYCMFATLLGYIISMMYSMKAPKWLIVVFLLTITFSPYYTNSMVTLLKDNVYSYSLMLFIAEIVQLLRNNTKMKHAVLLLFAALCTLCFRNDGKFIIIPCLVILFIFCRRQLSNVLREACRDRQKGNNVRIIAMLVIPVLLSYLLNFAVTEAYSVQKGSIREALSLPFQQTARYVLYHEEEVTDDEKQAIAAILDYDHLNENYNPRISDPVKNTFNKESTTTDLIRYFKVWLKQGLKHPGTYFCATLNQNYYLFYPFTENNIVYSKTLSQRAESEVYAKSVYEALNLTDAPFLPLKGIMIGWYQLCFSMPFIGLLSSTSVYMYAMLFSIALSIHHRRYKWLIAIIPLILCCGIIILAPAIQGHPRYAYPIVYSMPLLVAWLSELLKKDKAQVGGKV